METLYNGIVLPEKWPPKRSEYPKEPLPPPYLDQPPAVIPIDTGRQLFFDDFLIEETDLKRSFHRAEYCVENPVLEPDRPWELTGYKYKRKPGPSPQAMPFSDGVWYDPSDRIYKMWYFGGRGQSPSGEYAPTCYATSRDGISWEKPDLSVQSWLDLDETNIVHLGGRDSSTVWLDHDARDRRERFKMSLYRGGRLCFYRSPDGINWSRVAEGGKTGDRTTFFYNPFRKRWVFSIRGSGPMKRGIGRVRTYWESEDFYKFDDRAWADDPQKSEVVLWTSADSADPRREEFPAVAPQLYNLDAVAYESVILGLFSIWRGDYRFDAETEKAQKLCRSGRPKTNEVFAGFSRDGFHWHRPDRRPFLPISEMQGDWNWGNVQSAGGCCLIVGDRLYFYVSGRAGKSFPTSSNHDAGGSTGLAFLRRDGFASMDAGENRGLLTTRKLRFSGCHLFVNLEAPEGKLQVEVVDGNGQPIPPFTAENCRPVTADDTKLSVTWRGADDLSSISGRPVKFRFHLTNGKLYAFWVSEEETGKSGGYAAAGGPGFKRGRDI